MKKSAVWEMIEKESAKGYPGSAWRPVYLNTSWADLPGSSQGNIARIESGKYSTGIDLLSKIGDALGYELDFVRHDTSL